MYILKFSLSIVGSIQEEQGNDYKSVESILEQVHIKSRYKFGLPGKPSRASNGVKCNICANECCIEEGQKGFCGLRENRAGKLHHLTLSPDEAVVEWYYDALPTNCVAD
jgi:pyruvate formate lyase activating enzyme